jgi:KAP family P-loop domain
MQPLSPPVLAIPHEEAKSLLTRQIQEGESLRGAARRFLGNPRQDAVAGWLAKVVIWSDANERLLRRLFASGGAPEDFTRKRTARKRLTSSPNAGNLSETLGLIEAEQSELNEILSLLPADASPEPPSVASQAEQRQEKEPGARRTTWHAVQSTSIQDLPAAEDLLGFKPYVDAMAAFLANEKTQPPLTLSIEGEWGSGKSSFMLQLENALRRELKKGARFIRFNAWRHDQGEALWAAFALEFSRQLVQDRTWLVRRWKRLRLGLARLQRGQGWLGFLKLFVPLSGFVAASWVHREMLLSMDAELQALLAMLTTPLSVPVLQKVWSFFGNPFSVELAKLEAAPNYESRIPFLEQFHEDFRLLMECYASPTEKIFVFIDDLDRCEVPKASELLQALNLMIPESSRVIFILGVDREKVAAGIAMRHEKVLPLLAPPAPDSASKLPFDPVLAAAFGRDFLERFLQLPFRLPRPVPERLDGMLDLLLGVQGQPPASQATPEPGKAGPQLWPTPAPEPLPAEAKARRAEMVRKAEMDSPEVREVMKLVAPALEFNLRRLKQFLNVFRLSVYIANNTGLFDSGSTLTLSQLGKFVAIGQRWPELLEDLEMEPELLAELEDPKRPATCRATARWRRDAALLRLLQAGLDEGKGSEEHSLKGLDFQRLRSVATAIPRESGGVPSPPQSALVA